MQGQFKGEKKHLSINLLGLSFSPSSESKSLLLLEELMHYSEKFAQI
jgi:hypothetical protein